MFRSLISVLFIFILSVTVSAGIDKEEFQHKLDKAIGLVKEDPKAAFVILKDLQEKASLEKNSLHELEVSKILAHVLYNLGTLKELPELYAEIDSLTIENKITIYDVSYERQRAQYLLVIKDALGALKIIEKIKNDVFNSNDTVLMIDWHVQKSHAHRHLNDTELTLKHFLEADTLNNLIENEFTAATILRVNGDILWGQGQLEEALPLFIRAADFHVAKENMVMVMPLYTNIITLAMGTGQKEIALEYSEKLAKVKKNFSSEIGYYAGEVNRIFFFIQLEKYKEARVQALNTISLADSINRDDTHAQYLLGIAYRGLDKYDIASDKIKIAFDQSLKKRENGACVFYSHALYQTYYWKDHYQEALEWHETYKQFTDSVYNDKNRKEIEVIQARFDATTSELKVENLKAQAKIEKQQKNQLWMALLFSFILFSGFIFYLSQRRKKAKELQEKQLKILRLEKEKLTEKLEFKEKELISQVLNMTHKNTLLQNLKEEVEKVQKDSSQISLRSIVKSIEKSIAGDKDWDIFLKSFSSLHSSFMNKLKDIGKDLTPNETRLASLLRMNLSSKEIANIFNISNDGVKKARYRLRKKIDLDSDSNIQEYLLAL